MEYCINCKHFRAHKSVPATCHSPKLPINLVTGSPVFALCKDMRYSKGDCGHNANWFEFIEDADLDDLSTIPFGR